MKKLICLIFRKKNLIQISSVLPIIFVNNQTLFAQSTLPTVFTQGTITSPAKNAKSKTISSVQNIKDSGTTGQSVTTITQSGSGSSGNITVTTTNTINGDLSATNSTVVRVGDINLSGSNVGTATVRTTTNMKGGDFKDGGTHEFGVVDLTNLDSNKVEIRSNNTLEGQVNSQNDSSVSVGAVKVKTTQKPKQKIDGNTDDSTRVIPQIPFPSTTKVIKDKLRELFKLNPDYKFDATIDFLIRRAIQLGRKLNLAGLLQGDTWILNDSNILGAFDTEAFGAALKHGAELADGVLLLHSLYEEANEQVDFGWEELKDAIKDWDEIIEFASDNPDELARSIAVASTSLLNTAIESIFLGFVESDITADEIMDVAEQIGGPAGEMIYELYMTKVAKSGGGSW